MSFEQQTVQRSKDLFEASKRELHCSTDKLFCYLMAGQYIGAIVWAVLTSPRTWEGNRSLIHPHVWIALSLGGAIALPTVALTFLKPGETVTRWTVSVCQMLMSALLIHVSGGRIETHFSVFGSLAFIAFYREWPLLVPATLVVLLDHIIRGIYAPMSVYGVAAGAEWRFVEHAAWVVFEDVILVAGCVRALSEMRISADRQAIVEGTNTQVETLVKLRTQELLRSEERKSAILNHALDAIVSMDGEGMILEFNPAAESMFQRANDEVIGKNFGDLLVWDGPGDVEANGVRELLEAGQSKFLNERAELTAVRADGGSFPIEISITPVTLDQGTLFTAFIRDIAEQRRLETDLAHAQKMESIGQLAAGVAHEINTPNQYIGDNMRFLQESFESVNEAIEAYGELHEAVRTEGSHLGLVGKVDEVVDRTDLEFVLEEVPRAVTHALEGVDRVASIVAAMKDFSHPGQESVTTVDINRVIRSTITVARNEWKYVATIDDGLDPNLPPIEGHPGALGQVVLNLLINAVHSIKDRYGDEPSGVIGVRSRVVGESVEVSISDNGCGIPEHARARIFEPFYTTKGVGLGTGQGLAISHSVICERHGGQLEFETALSEGTTFTFRLPIESIKEQAA